MARPPIHPGEILAGELEELDMSAAELSRALHVPTNRITQILNGQRRSPPTPPCASATGLAPARNSGSTSRSSTKCASPSSRLAKGRPAPGVSAER